MSVQVTRKVAGLHLQAYQQGTAVPHRSVIAGVLAAWLHEAEQTVSSSSESHLAACVRQQLQESGLPQHMSALLTDAADGITAAAAAVSDASAPSVDSNTAFQAAANMSAALSLGLQLLNTYVGVCRWQATGTCSMSLAAALPAAPAAVRLILKTFRTYDTLQQLAGREGTSVIGR